MYSYASYRTESSSRSNELHSGLHYYAYRYYDPTVGRWLKRDPIEEEGGMNLCGFVYNKPLSWIDILGGSPWDRRGRVNITRRQFEDALRQRGRNISDRSRALLDRGCVGLCGIAVGVPFPSGMPEHTRGVKCYLKEAKAVSHKCPKNTRKQIFAKQGRWAGRNSGTPRRRTDGTIPNNSVVGNGGAGRYNYVTRIVLNDGRVRYAWMNHARSNGEQTVTFDDDLPEDNQYPKTMWCVRCIPCKDADGT